MIVEDEKINRLSIGEAAITDPEYSRRSKFFKYLIYDENNNDKVIEINSRIFYNAAHCKFLKEIHDLEINNDSVSYQSLFELRCYDYIQAYNQGQWQAVDDAEFDLKFLARRYNLFELKIFPNYVEKEELGIVEDIIQEIAFQKEISDLSESEQLEIKELLGILNSKLSYAIKKTEKVHKHIKKTLDNLQNKDIDDFNDDEKLTRLIKQRIKDKSFKVNLDKL